MSDYVRRVSIRMDKIKLKKIAWIAGAEGRSVNKQFEHLAKKCIAEYENQYGTITKEQLKEDG